MAASENLTVTKLNAWYGPAQALFDVSLTVAPNEIVGVIGRNGAGKTTLMRSIARIHRKVRGSIALGDRELTKQSPNSVAGLGVSHVREGGKSFLGMSVHDNLQLSLRLAKLRGKPVTGLDRAWEWFPFLRDRQEEKAAYLSGGQRQALALSVALLSQPSLLLLDEPSAGLAPTVARDFFQTLRPLCEADMTVVVVEQNPMWLAGFVHRTFIIESGVLGEVDEAAVDALSATGPAV